MQLGLPYADADPPLGVVFVHQKLDAHLLQTIDQCLESTVVGNATAILDVRDRSLRHLGGERKFSLRDPQPNARRRNLPSVNHYCTFLVHLCISGATVPSTQRTRTLMTFPDPDGQPQPITPAQAISADDTPISTMCSEAPAESAADRASAYGRYISSAAWQTSPARLAELEASGHRCRLCFASRREARLEVHHRTYRNFRCELAEDLTTLCHPCHLGVTGMERFRKYARSPFKPPPPTPAAPPPPALFDYRTPLEI